MPKSFTLWLIKSSALFSFLVSLPVYAQITPDSTLPTNSAVTRQGDTIEINQGTRAGDNLFHSFSDFSVPNGVEANFNNATDVVNIINRVTGGNVSDIQGIISANGAANLFLINPAGIIFGENASLNIGGSFFGSTADSVLFPEGEFSATNPENSSNITINAPIGLNFRDNPQPITNRSIVTDDGGTPDNFDDDDFIGLRVPENETLALLGGDVSIEGGFLSTIGGRIELGSVGENSTVSITPVEKGFDLSYEEVNNFQDINLSVAALVQNSGENPGDIQVQGRNISLVEGSGIGILAEAGQTGNLDILASESLTLDGNAVEVDLGDLRTQIYSDISGDATAENNQITIETPQLTITDGAQITATNSLSNGQGADIVITASNIVIAKPFFIAKDNPILSGIFAQVLEEGSGNGGNLTIETEKLTLNEGAQINTDTLGAGDGGDLLINATESINLSGSVDLSADAIFPSSLFANVGETLTATGNGGDITINTPRLEVKDGAQIATAAQNSGSGGTININAESILLSGTSPLAEFRGLGRSGIAINTGVSLIDEESGSIIPTTGTGGTLNLTSKDVIIEKGAFISADTFSLGDGGSANLDVSRLILRDGGRIGSGSLFGTDAVDTERGAGGTLKIDASESIEVTGIGEINGEPVPSSIFTLAESTGDAGDITLTTDNLSVRDGGEINASAEREGAAGNIDITANSIDLTDGEIIASTAAGDGGNITLEIADDITLEDNSRVSAQATGNANGGNIGIDTRFIVAFPGNNDILASAEQGRGGNINITADSLFGIAERPLNNLTNDINASSESNLDGNVTITTPEAAAIRGATQLQTNVIEAEQTTDKTCAASQATGNSNTLVVRGKGGIPPEPKSPLGADIFSIGGKMVGEDGTESDESELERSQATPENSVSSQVKPIY
ncbi:MAG: filamentous hemagglutinin N-terminal domain-containing protein, partial [Waterburya sp.]